MLIHNQRLCFKRLQMFLQESLGWLNMSCIWLALTLLSAKGHFFSTHRWVVGGDLGTKYSWNQICCDILFFFFFLILITSCRACDCGSARLRRALPCRVGGCSSLGGAGRRSVSRSLSRRNCTPTLSLLLRQQRAQLFRLSANDCAAERVGAGLIRPE